MIVNQEQIQHIQTVEQLLKRSQIIYGICMKLDNYQEVQLKLEQINKELIIVQQSVRCLSLFSPNENLKQIHTQNLKFLLIPFYRGDILGKYQTERRQNIELSKNYLIAFINLCLHYNKQGQQQQIFPKNLKKTWKNYQQNQNYRIQRDELITNEKEKKIIKLRYQNSSKIKQESQQRRAILDFITLSIYNAVNQIKLINQEIQMLKYKQSLENDPKILEMHEKEKNKVIPKMKVWDIKKPEQLQQQFFLPSRHPACLHCSSQNERKQLISKVWRENSNQPTMTLEEVADLQMQNLKQRTERQKKYQEENKEDTDSEKQQVDARMKKKARQWDDWKDEHEKGAGNKGQY